MSPGFDEDLTQRIEDAFDLYLQESNAGRLADAGDFVAAQPAELRQRLADLIDQYELLREKLKEGPRGFRAGRELDHYRLLREIGRGAMGMVFEAHDQILDRRVAVKLLFPIYSLTESVLERFRREASAGGRLSHPGIVAVIEVGEDQDTHYIVQELVRGGSVEQHLERLKLGKHLPPDHFRETAVLVAEIAEALGEAHSHGVVHRDVKPANLLLTEAGRPKVADFGLAWIEEEISHTGTGVTTGTPFYMSPEQADPRQGSVGPHTDVFSLGVTLYEALTLVRPFQGDTRQQVADKILHNEPTDPRKLRSRVPRDLAVICLKALEKSPQDRYADGAAFAADLRRYLADEPIQARPPSPLQVAWKWCHRHKAIASTGAVLLASLAIVSALSLQLRLALGANQEVLAQTEPLLRVLDERERADLATLMDLSAFAQQRLGERPELQATWLSVIGRALAIADEHEAAIDALAVAWGHYARDPAANLRDGLAVGEELARTYVRAGRLPEAEGLLLELIDGWPLAPDDPDRLTLKGELLSVYLRGPDMWNLSDFRARYGEPEILLRSLRESREKQYGEASPRALEVWLDEARYMVADERIEEATRLLERAQGRMSAHLPPLHALTFEQMELLSRLRVTTGNMRAAAALSRRLIANVEESGLRFEPHDSGELHLRLAEGELLHRFFDDAIQNFDEAARRSSDPEFVATALLGQARSHVERGIRELDTMADFLVAHELLERALAGMAGMPPPQGRMRARLLLEDAYVLALSRQWKPLTDVAQRALELGPAELEPDERVDLEELRALGLAESGRESEALELRFALWQRLAESRGAWEDRALCALHRLVRALVAVAREDEARAELLEWRRRALSERPATVVADQWEALFDGYLELQAGAEAAEQAWARGYRSLAASAASAEPARAHLLIHRAVRMAPAEIEDTRILQRARNELYVVAVVSYLLRTHERLEARLLMEELWLRISSIEAQPK